MSLTNPKDVVTEERLSEFYQGILPYLGGMPEAIANKFSRSDIYSTTEKMIGQWTDGKPLYMKVVTATPSSTAPTLATNVDTFVNAFIKRRYESGSSYWVCGDGISNANSILFSITSGTLKANIAASGYNAGSATFTVFYTKTTDSAISIGVDTDYSTTEKIVGTWIDGKPIWQNTVSTGGNVPSGATLILRTAMASTGYDTILYTKTS